MVPTLFNFNEFRLRTLSVGSEDNFAPLGSISQAGSTYS